MPNLEKTLSPEITEKYFVLNNSLIAVAKANPKDRIDVEVGDTKQTDFLPQVKIQRWDNEVNASFRLIHDEKNPVVVTEADKIKWQGEKVEAHFYDIAGGDGGYEFEVVLKERPLTNKVEFSLNTKGLDFFYQPELTKAEIKEGCNRPDNVIGSYAIFSTTQKINYVGGKEYKTGKLGHIYRPKITDVAGTEVWGELNIDLKNGILSIAIPQDFLDKAVYPVLVDPTFGYMTTGGTSITKISTNTDRANILSSLLRTAVTGDTLVELNVYGSNGGSGSGTVGASAYTFAGGVPVTRLIAEQTFTLNAAAKWWQIAGLSGSMSNAVVYALALGNWAKGTATGLTFYYDTAAAGSSINAAGALPATWSQTSTDTTIFSLFATYRNAADGTYKDIYNKAGTFNWVCPAGVTSVDVACWGGGGAGGGAAGGGGGGGAYAASTAISVTSGNSYTIIIGSAGGNSTFATTTVVAAGGTLGNGGAGGGGGGAGGTTAASTGNTKNAGGNGGNRYLVNTSGGGGGGAGGKDGAGVGGTNGIVSAGGNGGNGDNNSGGAGATGGAGQGPAGTNNTLGGGGGAGGFTNYAGGAGGTYGAGGGGGGQAQAGGAGAAGGCEITYVISSGSALTKALSDTMTLAESLVKGSGKGLVDTMAIAETAGKVNAFIRAISDTMTLTEIFIKSLHLSETDAVTLADSIVKSYGTKLSLADNVGLAEIIASRVGKMLADGVALADIHTDTFIKSLGDTVSLAEIFKKSMGLVATDAFALADAIATQSGKSASLSDTATLADALSAITGKGATLTDNVAITEGLAKTVGINRIDNLVLADVINRLFQKPLADSVAILDSFSKTAGVGLGDTVLVVDALSRASGKNITDSLIIAEAVSRGFSKMIIDTILSSEALVLTSGKTKNLIDVISLVDTAVNLVAYQKFLVDTMGLSDAAVTLLMGIADRIYQAQINDYKHKRGAFSGKTGIFKRKNDAADNKDDIFDKKLF